MKVKSKKRKFLIWREGWAIALIINLLGIGAYISSKSPHAIGGSLEVDIITTFMLLVFPTLIYIGMSPRLLSVIEFSDEGVRKSFLGRFFVRELKWADVKEIRAVFQVGTWIFFSSSDIGNLSYDGKMKRKDTVWIAYTPKVLKIIKEYASVNPDIKWIGFDKKEKP